MLALRTCFLFKEIENLELKKFKRKSLIKNKPYKITKEIIVKDCERISESFLGKIYEDIFYQNFQLQNNIKKAKKFINNWYSSRGYQLSEIKKIEIFQKKDKITYFFQNKEPIVKSFSVYTDFEQKKKKFFTIGISNIYFLSKILDISFGKLFQFNPINWNRLKTSEGMISSDFTIKDQNLGDFGNFLDITLKLVKTPTISIEPEITLIDNHLSSSLNLNEKNLFGTGISVKQKVYLKKFNPYFFKFEIDDRNLKKNQSFVMVGKYKKKILDYEFVFKKFLNNKRISRVKINLNPKIRFWKNENTENFNSCDMKFSFSLSNARFLKNHSCFEYFLFHKISKFDGAKCCFILNSKLQPFFIGEKLNGIICTLENKFFTNISLKNLTSSDTIHSNTKSSFFKIKKPINLMNNKMLGLNSIISKNMSVFLYFNYSGKNQISSNSSKKIEIKLEMNQLFSFSVQFSNYGKIKAKIS